MYSAVLSSALMYSAFLYSAFLYSAVLYSAVQCREVQPSAVQCCQQADHLPKVSLDVSSYKDLMEHNCQHNVYIEATVNITFLSFTSYSMCVTLHIIQIFVRQN